MPYKVDINFIERTNSRFGIELQIAPGEYRYRLTLANAVLRAYRMLPIEAQQLITCESLLYEFEQTYRPD